MRGWTLALCALVAAGSAGTAWTQEVESASPPVRASIPLPEIAVEREALLQRLAAAAQQLTADQRIDEIAERLPEAQQALRRQGERSNEILATNGGLEALAELAADWTRRGDEMRAWREALTARAEVLDELLAELDARETLWSSTSHEAREQRAPGELLDATRNALDALADSRRQAQLRRDRVLSLQTRVAEADRLIGATLDRIRAAREEVRSQLFEPDAPVLWEAGIDAPVTDRVRAATARDLERLSAFLESRRRLLALGVALFLALLAVALAVRRRVPEHAHDLGPAVAVFERPYSLALLVALLGSGALFDHAPGVVTDLTGLALLAPVLRLVPPLVEPPLRPILYWLGGFYLFDRIRDVLDAVPVLDRALFASEGLVVLAVLFWLLRPARLRGLPRHTRLPRGLGLGMRLGAVAMLLSVVANVLGYTSFAKVVGEGTLAAAYLAAVARAGIRAARGIFAVALHAPGLRGLSVLRRHASGLRAGANRLFGLIGAAIWLLASLSAFGLREDFLAFGRLLLLSPLTLGTVAISLGDLVAFGLTVAAAVYLSRGIRMLLDEDVLPRLPLRRGVGYAISSTAQYGVLLVGFVLAVAAAGVDLGKFTLLAGAFGVGIGFGLQNVVNNFVSGLILLYERPVQVGDTIEVGGLLGEVRRIGIRSSTVRTIDGAEVIVPNGNMIAENVINWTLSDKHRRVVLPVGVAYGSDLDLVLSTLQGVIDSHDRVMEQPQPVVLFRGFGDSSLDFELRFWARDYVDYLRLQSEVGVRVNSALREAGIEIPFPQRDLHLRSVDEEAARRMTGGGD